MSDEIKNESQQISKERLIYLKLFNKIMHLEHDNAHSKEKSDKAVQDEIKKAIQTMVQVN